MKKLLFAFLLAFSLSGYAQLKSPADFLPEYGKQVSFYHEIETYFKYLKENSEYIKHESYGFTSQGRSLNVYYISTPENLKNLEAIRDYHLYSIGMTDKKPAAETEKAIVWLSFNVHGNEIGAAESSMKVAYELLNPQNTTTKQWLENTIVILDPCLNPDGFSRYGNWLRDISGKNLHPELTDREHIEPWPGGRQNHYAYDLNRDWAWQTQVETQQRMVLYNRWMPEVHVDVHEMGYNEPYFFPPAAEPFHDFITKPQRDFHNVIGENTSKKFDAEGWNYYTRERFDLFYPSYGDTYPSFNGAIGMTYEQGGIGAGRAVLMQNGNILTLQDRINHHTVAVLTAVETASGRKEKLIADFKAYFKDSRQNPKGKYKTYVIKNDGKAEQLAVMLKQNNIQFAYADETKKLSGYHYQSDKEKAFSVESGDMIIQASQPKSVLTQVLFEPYQRLSDSLTYDITAWALPHAFGIESYALKNALVIKTRESKISNTKVLPETAYAFYIPWNNRTSAKIAASLLKKNVKVRYSKKNSAFGDIKLNMGDLIVLKSDNTKLPEFEKTMAGLLAEKNDYSVIKSGFSTGGTDLGGENFQLLKAPKILLLSGKNVSPTDFGQVWFYMDQIIDYPVSILDADYLGMINLTDFNTLILADGWYDLSDSQRKSIDDFISKGGKTIAIQNALSLFENREGYNLSQFATNEEKDAAKKQSDEEALTSRFKEYQKTERRSVSNGVPGAIIENVLDKTHPLSYGLGDKYYSLKTSDKYFKVLKNVWNVAYVPENYKSYGFIGANLKKKLGNTVSFAVEPVGRGKMIYMVDNPLFRGFWENGNLLFSNALFLVD
ncbi:M14 family metallopeptidase [Flavobacterium lindanitolerans]|jgi:hypothetical protein|uniref:M14 family metallopeptidase n=1 Tax=Flavobacterium lindanitolerans TaxID=428988 RepID=UPI0023F42A6D|nr:M14 family metallopeptidase [Flavobacterium lindanitolerans]